MFFLENGILKSKYNKKELIDDNLSDEYTEKLLSSSLADTMVVQIVDITNVCDKIYAIHLFDGSGILLSVIDYKTQSDYENKIRNYVKLVNLENTYKIKIGSIIQIQKFEIRDLSDIIKSFNLETYYELSEMDDSVKRKKIFHFEKYIILGFQSETIYNCLDDDMVSNSLPECSIKEEEKKSITKEASDCEIIDYITPHEKNNDEMKSFTPLDRLGLVKKRNVEVMGIIIQIENVISNATQSCDKINLRRFQLIDMTKTRVSVACWGKDADEFKYKIGTVVMLNNCTLTNFRGVSLSIHKSTYITEIHKETTHRLGRKLLKWWDAYQKELNKNSYAIKRKDNPEEPTVNISKKRKTSDTNDNCLDDSNSN